MLRFGIITICLAMWLALLAGPGISGQQPPSDDPKTPEKSASFKRTAPKIFFSVRKYDFGEVFEGAEIKYDFVVENRGNSPLVITNIRPG